jgi:ABC-type Fe3+ transport system substrate-binding protein
MMNIARIPRSLTMIAAAIALVSSVANAAEIRALWIKRPETQQLLESFIATTSQSSLPDRRVEVLIREVRQVSELFLAVRDALERDRADLIFGLTLSQVQFLANAGLLQPFASGEIKARFSRSLYVSPPNRKFNLDGPSDQVIAAPINVTLAAICYDKRNERIARTMEGQTLSLEDIATNKRIERIGFPDPRTDPAGRGVLLSAFLSSNVHSGWSLFEMLDAKIGSYTRSNSFSCAEVNSESTTKNVDVAFTTVDAAGMVARDNPWLASPLLREAIPVSNVFAAILRDRSSDSDGAVIRAYAQLTDTLLEKQIRTDLRKNLTRDAYSSLLATLYDARDIFFYRSSGQIVDEWAARYDHKSLTNTFGK